MGSLSGLGSDVGSRYATARHSHDVTGRQETCMVPGKQPIGRSNETAAPSISELLTLLEHPLRRIVLGYLSVHDPPVSLAELVTVVAEDGPLLTADRRQLTIELHHKHLPQLSDCGIISYDTETNTVERAFDDPAIEAALYLLCGSSGRM